jgi:hypothetical protein
VRLLAEQGAVPLDQLARFLAVDLAVAVALVQAFEERGWSESRRFLVRDYPWCWLTGRGARLSGTGLPRAVPDIGGIEHRRAVNEVRLHLARRAPAGRWICEREVLRRRGPDEFLPDGVLEIDGERHAIEAELSRKQNRQIRLIVAAHSARYDAVVYFCGPRTYSLLKRVQGERRWPKLVVRRMPEAPPC